MTNSRKATPSPPVREVQEICVDLWDSRKIKKVFPREGATIEAIRIAAAKGLKAAQVFDCTIALTARDNHLDHIWTDNLSDFKQLDLVNAENPLTKHWQLVKDQDQPTRRA
jgi:hypothetical protein